MLANGRNDQNVGRDLLKVDLWEGKEIHLCSISFKLFFAETLNQRPLLLD